jgi:Mlc titration factor MtfA (ptsG expression regulator)
VSELIITGAIVVGLWLLLNRKSKEQSKTQYKVLAAPEKWKSFLMEKVAFYRHLDESKRLRFETDIQNFLREVRISGVQTEVSVEDRLLVASSAVIPLFGFPAWTYNHLDEVLLYPDSFDRNFNIGSKEEIITGMVGTGEMEGKMILSKPSLYQGFDIYNDKKNVGIHEFVHLFDKETGNVDGIPPGLEEHVESLPWLELIRTKTDEILAETSDINPYGATNKQEFFAVASEYFFERPDLLKEKHPNLYNTLSKVFKQDLSQYDPDQLKVVEPSRNAPCPCGSGKKYKRCCGI